MKRQLREKKRQYIFAMVQRWFIKHTFWLCCCWCCCCWRCSFLHLERCSSAALHLFGWQMNTTGKRWSQKRSSTRSHLIKALDVNFCFGRKHREQKEHHESTYLIFPMILRWHGIMSSNAMVGFRPPSPCRRFTIRRYISTEIHIRPHSKLMNEKLWDRISASKSGRAGGGGSSSSSKLVLELAKRSKKSEEKKK